MDVKKILVVDDEQDIVKGLKIKLEAKGCEVATAYTGTEAIEKAKNEKPDVIVLDVMLPDFDGFEVCSRLKQEEATKLLPVIFLTAKEGNDQRWKGLTKGGVAYITKPFEFDSLWKVINDVIVLKSE